MSQNEKYKGLFEKLSVRESGLNMSDGGILADAKSILLLRARVEEFGFADIYNALTGRIFAGLFAEASMRSHTALPAEGSEANPYRSSIAELGDFARSFLNSASVAGLLQSVFGQSLKLSEQASCYTYYGPGSFIGRHRDRPDACAATLIVYLEAISPKPQSPNSGLVLRVFEESSSHEAEPRLTILTRSGTLVAGRGSQFWHERPTLQPGERVVALTACFRKAD